MTNCVSYSTAQFNCKMQSQGQATYPGDEGAIGDPAIRTFGVMVRVGDTDALLVVDGILAR